MREDQPLFRIGSSLLVILVVIFFITMAVYQFQSDLFETAEAAGLGSQAAAPAKMTKPATSAALAIQPGPVQPLPAGWKAPAGVVSAFNRAGCAGCHVIPGVPGANGRVGPDLSKIGVVVTARVAGLSLAEYLRQSIVAPNAFIAPDCWGKPCPSGVMLQNFASTLSAADLDTIVGYLSTLGTGKDMVMMEAAPVEMVMSLPLESVLKPFMPLPKAPPKESQIALGKYLFFDERLSGNVSLSCASCHLPKHGFTDGQALSRGYPSTAYFRNTQTLYNTVFQTYLYWDGRMDGSDMPTLVRDHLTEAHFMHMDGRLMFERLKQVPDYVAAFQAAFGGEPSFGKVLNAITAYVQTLNSPAGPYDAALAGDTSGFNDIRKPYMENRWPDTFVEMHPEDATRLGLESGDMIRMWSDRVLIQHSGFNRIKGNELRFSWLQENGHIHTGYGECDAVVIVTNAVKPGLLFTNFLEPRSPSNSLVHRVPDPITNRYRFKLATARVKKLGESPYKNDFRFMSFKPRDVV